MKIKLRYVVCGQSSDEPWATIRYDNEGQADEYYTRLPDGSVARDNHGQLTAFAN